MAFNAQKTILLEKQYLYVRASKGFELEGVSTERIWTNTGYYRFLVENVAFTLGNSYVTIHYDLSDVDFIAYCSDLFMEELQNSIVVAVENIQSYLEQFAETNHEDVTTLGEGVSSALELIYNSVKDKSIFDFSDVSTINVFYWNGSALWNVQDDVSSMEVGDTKYFNGMFSIGKYMTDFFRMNGGGEAYMSGFGHEKTFLVVGSDNSFGVVGKVGGQWCDWFVYNLQVLYKIVRIA